MTVHVGDDTIVEVVAPHSPVVRVAPPAQPVPEVGPPQPPPPFTVVPTPGVQGPEGRTGPPGPTGPEGASGDGRGVRWFSGIGPPGALTGSQPGDMYLDLATGDVYKLGD